MKNAWNQEINLKKNGKRDLPASKDKNLAKILKENDKNWMVEPRANAEREKSKELFDKCLWKRLILLFKKPDSRVSISRKSASTGRNRQRLPLSNFKKFKNFDRSKNRLDQSNQAEAHHIFWGKTQFLKTSWFDSKHLILRTKMHEYEMVCFSNQEF